jgi:serine/threonine protein kinase
MMKQLSEENSQPFVLSPDQFSEELRQFIYACVRFNPSTRPTARQLLEFDFIKKNENTKVSNLLYSY